MHKGDTIPGVITMLFGLLFVAATAANPKLTAISQTSDGVPGAGFFPYLLGFGVMILGALLVIRGLRQKGQVQYINLEEETKQNLKILALSVLGIVVFLAFWKLTGQFIIGMLILCLYLNRLFQRSWKFNIIYSAVFTAFIYFTFFVGFSIQFVA